jgi:hypothetical protein
MSLTVDAPRPCLPSGAAGHVLLRQNAMQNKPERPPDKPFGARLGLPKVDVDKLVEM